MPISGSALRRFLLMAIVCLPISGSVAAAEAGAAKLESEATVERHWSFPLKSNQRFSRETLSPMSCGQCHYVQYQAWQESLHARAFGAGILGQALELEPFELRACLNCHAPLVEQFIGFENTMEKRDIAIEESFASHGVLCAACHVRQDRVYGPPKTDRKGESSRIASSPHGEVTRVAWFSQPRFCKSCHQGPTSAAENEKPLMNTYNEWASTAFADRGVTCQNCHMPGRAHEWKGIHYPEMVRRGIEASYEIDGDRVKFTIKNSGVGHAFPTYVTPRIVMRGAPLSLAGEPIEGMTKSYVITRNVTYTASGWNEITDTRLMPGTSASIEISWDGASQIAVWLEIDPDYFYRTKTYPHALTTLAKNSKAHAFIVQALHQTESNRYRLFERTIQKPDSR